LYRSLFLFSPRQDPFPTTGTGVYVVWRVFFSLMGRGLVKRPVG